MMSKFLQIYSERFLVLKEYATDTREMLALHTIVYSKSLLSQQIANRFLRLLNIIIGLYSITILYQSFTAHDPEDNTSFPNQPPRGP